MGKKILLFSNGSSGKGDGRIKLYDIVEELTAGGGEVTVYPISPEKGLTTQTFLAQHPDIVQEYDVVSCIGGDGTLNHLVNDLLEAGLHPAVGYIPSGSTNDFAESLGLTAEVKKACKTMLGGQVFSIDVGSFNDRFFNYVAAFGAFTDVSYATAQDVKNVLGHAAYILESIVSLPQALSMRIHLKAKCYGTTLCEGDYLYGAVSNSTQVGGFNTMDVSKVKLDDGLFEVMLIRAPEDLGTLNTIVTSLLSGKPDNKYVEFFRTDEICFEATEPVSWTLDGEFGGRVESTEIRLCPKALGLLVPAESQKELSAGSQLLQQ